MTNLNFGFLLNILYLYQEYKKKTITLTLYLIGSGKTILLIMLRKSKLGYMDLMTVIPCLN